MSPKEQYKAAHRWLRLWYRVGGDCEPDPEEDTSYWREHDWEAYEECWERQQFYKEQFEALPTPPDLYLALVARSRSWRILPNRLQHFSIGYQWAVKSLSELNASRKHFYEQEGLLGENSYWQYMRKEGVLPSYSLGAIYKPDEIADYVKELVKNAKAS